MYLKIICILLMCSCYVHSDNYLLETMKNCKSSRNVWSCLKYRIIKYLSNSVLEEGYFPLNISGYVEVIKVKKEMIEEIEGNARYMAQDDAFTKFWKYFQRLGNKYVTNHAFKIALPSNCEIGFYDPINGFTDDFVESRKRKNKVAIIPLLALFKLFKIKYLLAGLLLAVIFIKKTLFLSAILFPYFLNQLKDKIHHLSYPHHREEYYEYYEPQHDSYRPEYFSKDWSRNNVKRM